MTDGETNTAAEVFDQYDLTKKQRQAAWSALPKAIKTRANIRRSIPIRLQCGPDAYHAAHQTAAHQIKG